MAVLIDPPSWPAHGTTFSHLVSDSSLAELHAFAAGAGVPPRAFDLDHYDVAASRYDVLVAAGAVPVSGGELIRRLRASGLRVRARERTGHVLTALRLRWPSELGGATAAREELLTRWSEPHRRYHAPTHLLAVLEALDVLTEPERPPLPVVLAAWFHDAVYDGVPGFDEQASAALVGRLLRPGPPASAVTAELVAEVERLVLVTADHRVADGDAHGALLCDADLSVLGGSPAAYARYVEQVRHDYAHVPDDAWRTGRAAVLQQLLALDPLFRTARAQERWAAAATDNLDRELRSLLGTPTD